MIKNFIKALVLLPSFIIANNVDIPLSSPIYEEIERLQALGAISSLSTTTKPYNTKELLNTVSKIDDTRFQSAKEELLNEIRRYNSSGLLDTSASAYYSHEQQPLSNVSGLSDGDGSVFFANKNGLRLDKDGNVQISTRFQYINEYFSFVGTPVYTNSLDENGFELHDTYARATWKNVNLTLGKEALWMGPSHSGTLLLSNNANPINMLRISNVKPFKLNFLASPVSNIIGLVDVDFFVGRLDHHEHIMLSDKSINDGYPKIVGMQLSFKPLDSFEWGLYRTALYGGGGRDEGFDTFIDVLFPTGDLENISALEPGDQKAGVFATYNSSNNYQPFKLYAEGAGEDAGGMFPSKWSYIGGVKLFDIGNIRGLSLNYEYISMDESNAWYLHHIYKDGYTNDGRIMGLSHGGSGDVHFVNTTYQPSMQRTLYMGYARDDFDNGSKSNSLSIGIRERFDNNIEIGATAGYNDSNIYNDNYFVNISGKILQW